jgi:nucleotide-binding universal stress UspA family protein
MKRIRRIMVATDFTACAEGAAQVAAQLARQLGAAIDVVTVIDTARCADAFTEPTIDRERIAAMHKEALRRARTFGEQHFAEIKNRRTHVRDGRDVVDEIVAAAQNLKSDLIVLGTHGATGVDHLLLGSYAEKVARTSPVPVMTVRGAL